MRLEVSARAQKDIDQVFQYGLEDFSEAQARTYSRELLDLLDLILATPKMGFERNEFKRPLRTMAFYNHLVIYRIGRGKLRILRILDGKQNWKKIL
jgi:toxin ParE1/3/4